jgi:hypothetical protein
MAVYLLADSDWTLVGSFQGFYRPLPHIILLGLFLLWLVKIKQANWKNNLKLFIVCSGLTLIFTTTFIHTSQYNDLLTQLLNLLSDTNLESFQAITESFSRYHISKIILFDIFACVGMYFGLKLTSEYES